DVVQFFENHPDALKTLKEMDPTKPDTKE
ncbi:TPA: transcriptional regulator MntR, partial [Listeria innocua]